MRKAIPVIMIAVALAALVACDREDKNVSAQKAPTWMETLKE